MIDYPENSVPTGIVPRRIVGDDFNSTKNPFAPTTSTPKAHSHYFKDVRGLDYIDVYRVLSLFEVSDPCIQHAVKKLLAAGKRGAKSTDKDVREAIDTMVRYQEMRKERPPVDVE